MKFTLHFSELCQHVFPLNILCVYNDRNYRMTPKKVENGNVLKLEYCKLPQNKEKYLYTNHLLLKL